jgi:dolichol-phosphate mannosyltransferase
MAELSVILPTFKERDNVVPILEVITRDLQGIQWEVIFVDDDSPDGTAEVVRELAQHNPAIRVIHRIGRRGLASACIEGMLSSSAPIVAVMDADLQHDSSLLRPMFEALRSQQYDMACGSRYMEGGDFGAWTGKRQNMSRFATWVCQKMLRVQLTDPMSGFFMLRREYLSSAVRNLSAQGYKIFLDLVTATNGKARILELPYSFRTRVHGESKLDSTVIIEFGLMLIERRLPGIPLSFLQFALVGALGALLHLAVLGILLRTTTTPFITAQIWAALAAMTFNFIFNNIFTHRQNKLKGFGFVRGLLSFYIVCSLGAWANLALAERLYTQGWAWWGAGLIGAAISSVWNYSVTSMFTWKSKS